METQNNLGCGCGSGNKSFLEQNLAGGIFGSPFQRNSNSIFRRDSSVNSQPNILSIDDSTSIAILARSGLVVMEPEYNEYKVLDDKEILDLDSSRFGNINLEKIKIISDTSNCAKKAIVLPTINSNIIVPLDSNNKIISEKSIIVTSINKGIMLSDLKGKIIFTLSEGEIINLINGGSGIPPDQIVHMPWELQCVWALIQQFANSVQGAFLIVFCPSCLFNLCLLICLLAEGGFLTRATLSGSGNSGAR